MPEPPQHQFWKASADPRAVCTLGDDACQHARCQASAHGSIILQIGLHMHQWENLQMARRATTPGDTLSVALVHILQVEQVRTDLQ